MIYLDNAATSWPKAPGTAKAVYDAIDLPLGNSGRSSHGAGIRSDRILFGLREGLADFFSLGDSSRIVFTSGATESLNTVILGLLKPGDRVLTSSMEHNSVMRPLRYLEREKSLEIVTFPSDPATGYPDLKQYIRLLDEKKTALVITTAASNVNGIIFPVEEMARIATTRGVPLCVDAAQAAGETPLSPESWGIDFLCFSGHKGFLGPAGTGGLYIADPDRLPPLKRGGTGSRSDEEFQPLALPDKFESGTQNIPGLAGWHHSMAYLLSTGPGDLSALHTLFLEKLRSLDTLEIVGNPPGNPCAYTPVVSLVPRSCPLSSLTSLLNGNDIAARAGLHCAPGAHKTLGTLSRGGTLRLSPGPFTTVRDIETVCELLKEKL